MAPFKSQAQRAKFAELVKNGKMKQSTFDEWNRDTPHKIPERVERPAPTKVKTAKVIR